MLNALPVAERKSPSPADVYLGRFTAPTSARTLTASVELVARIVLGFPKQLRVDLAAVPWSKLERAHVTAIRARLAERYAPASTNRHLSALRGVLQESWRAGLLSAEQLAHLNDAARDLPHASARAMAEAALRPDEIEALFLACAKDKTTTGARDAALLALLFGVGLRRAEAVAVQLADFARETGRLVVLGKGSKVAALYLPPSARKTIEDWLHVRGLEPGALIRAVNKGGRVMDRGLNPGQVLRVCARRALDARLERKFRPHAARASTCGQAIDVTDTSSAQALMRHSSPVVTSRYDLRGERRLQTLADRMSVPHFPRPRKDSATCSP